MEQPLGTGAGSRPDDAPGSKNRCGLWLGNVFRLVGDPREVGVKMHNSVAFLYQRIQLSAELRTSTQEDPHLPGDSGH